MYPKLIYVLYQESTSPCAEDVVRGVTFDDELATLWGELSHENWVSIEEVFESETRLREVVYKNKEVLDGSGDI